MASKYQVPESAAIPIPSVTGRFLAHNPYGRIIRAFYAADLYLGAKRLTKPTQAQSAALAGVNRTYAFWAVKRQAERAEIEAGRIPLVPAPARMNGNSDALIVPDAGIDDAELISIARYVGPDRMLAASIAAGH